MDPPVLRVIRPRDPLRSPDVVVEPSSPSHAEPITARAVPHPRAPAEPPSSTDLALEPLDEAIEAVRTGELLVEPYLDFGEATPVTGVSSWQRGAPPPLPEGS